MRTSLFLWPQANVRRALAASWHGATIESVEGQLRALFPGGHPVLASSGRAALALCVAHRRPARGDLVDIFPYASHCVVDAVARHATPQLPGERPARLRIVYHQWGFVQESGVGDAIEDAADTLCAPGAALFPAGGALEIWSLPKIIATLGGGVIWCRSEEDARQLREARDRAGARVMQWGLRMLGQKFPTAHWWWQGAEPLLGRPSRLQLGELTTAIASWDAAVADRQEKLQIVWPLAPSWLARAAGRYPPVVPVNVSAEEGEAVAREFGLSAGMRHFEKVSDGTRHLVKLLPVPIHQDMEKSLLRAIVARLSPLVQRL
jgi:putative PLP-dependent aminotransferase (TIGR04422 family)